MLRSSRVSEMLPSLRHLVSEHACSSDKYQVEKAGLIIIVQAVVTVPKYCGHFSVQMFNGKCLTEWVERAESINDAGSSSKSRA